MWYPGEPQGRRAQGRQGRQPVLGQNFANTPKPVLLDYPPRMVRGTVYVPLRFVAQTLGAKVRFDRRTKTARVDLPMESA